MDSGQAQYLSLTASPPLHTQKRSVLLHFPRKELEEATEGQHLRQRCSEGSCLTVAVLYPESSGCSVHELTLLENFGLAVGHRS